MVVDVGGRAGAGQGPEQEQAVIHDIEGLGLVAVVVLAPGLGGRFARRRGGFGSIRMRSWAVGASVVVIPNSE